MTQRALYQPWRGMYSVLPAYLSSCWSCFPVFPCKGGEEGPAVSAGPGVWGLQEERSAQVVPEENRRIPGRRLANEPFFPPTMVKKKRRYYSFKVALFLTHFLARTIGNKIKDTLIRFTSNIVVLSEKMFWKVSFSLQLFCVFPCLQQCFHTCPYDIDVAIS